MRRCASVCLAVLLFIAIALILGLNGCGGVRVGAPKFGHIVVIFQENRTPDNLFQDLVLIARGADIASSGLNSLGQTIPLTPIPLGIDYDLSHAHSAFTAMYDDGKMDGADKVAVNCAAAAGKCPLPNAQFHYVRPSDVAPYFQLAEQYTFGDRMFQTNQGPSFPAHQFIISGTSAPTATSSSFVAENPAGVPPNFNLGCIAPPAEFVTLINANGAENMGMYPCTDHPTLTDELNAKGITWRYYAPSAGGLWTGPNAIQHMCVPNNPPPNGTKCTGPDWVKNVVLEERKVLTDIKKGNLAQVSWVIPDGRNSDHAGVTENGGGPSWVATVVNAIGNSPYWADTAIIITWDDWGGWYDHVPPSKIVNDGVSWGSGYVYGFRVPLIVVSPFAKPAHISHVNHDFGSILNLIEKNFILPSLGYADAYADDLVDCFDFNQKLLTFNTINAPISAADFLNDTRPKTDPDND